MKKLLLITCLVTFGICSQTAVGKCEEQSAKSRFEKVDEVMLKNFIRKGSKAEKLSTETLGTTVQIYTTIECKDGNPITTEEFYYAPYDWVYVH
jgi:hypothetical protein